jgi:hypothetical protein
MKNVIRSNGKVFKRRSAKLKSGEIQCGMCGDWKKVGKLTDKHFDVEYLCKTCSDDTKPEPKKIPKQKVKLQLAEDCPHRPLFGCVKPTECVGCYHNPVKKMALMINEDEDKKTARDNWFYGTKKHSKACLEILDDIKRGKGLHRGGTRCYLKYARKSEDEG